MEMLTKTELYVRRREIVDKIQKGTLFIYPTDTIYGLGCNAEDDHAVAKIRKIKRLSATPLSVIVPSVDWIRDNCVITKKTEMWLQKLPGPFTLILQLKNKHAVAENVAPKSKTIGIRFIDHWFMETIQKCGVPLITTSANKRGEPFMTSVDDLNKDIERNIEFMIYEGKKKGRPSKIVDVETEKVIER
ncbi:threonylcarbamoyl-AMP synthase [Candidatus Woesearchaeota archaeon CG10_big_fil_rev_8_21_14_0_10_36_11]|nr:MAG: threonylcarbamoyl-AMP synthase [Candidatus Woesearchaeota archaeon CG10_big_fil_rev_8_21_14_0_10_36_11]